MDNQLPSTSFPQPSQPINLTPGQPVTPPPQKNILYPLALAIIVGMSVIGVAGYSIKQRVFPPREITVVPTPIPTQTQILPTDIPTATPTVAAPDLTGDWDIYTGKEYTFKHPKNLKFDTDGAETGVENIRFNFMGQKQIDSGRTQSELSDGYMFIVAKRGSTTEKTPAEWAVTSREQSILQCEGITTATFTQPKRVTVGEVTGMQFTGRGCRADFTTSFLNHNNTVYEVTQMYVGDEVDLPQYEEITNQMLRSIQFL